MKRKKKNILERTKKGKKIPGEIKLKDKSEDLLWNMVGYSSSKDGDLSVNHDEYLYGKRK